MDVAGAAAKPGTVRRFGRGLYYAVSFLAAVATIASTILAFIVAHQETQISSYRAKVNAQASAIRSLQARPAPSHSSFALAQDYLTNLPPTVDNAGLSSGPAAISGTNYENSVSFSCGGYGPDPAEAWNVADKKTLTAVAGVADNAEDEIGRYADLTFTDQDGRQLGQPMHISLGHPANVSLSLAGVTQLAITCTPRDDRTGAIANTVRVTLGNANISG